MRNDLFNKVTSFLNDLHKREIKAAEARKARGPQMFIQVVDFKPLSEVEKK